VIFGAVGQEKGGPQGDAVKKNNTTKETFCWETGLQGRWGWLGVPCQEDKRTRTPFEREPNKKKRGEKKHKINVRKESGGGENTVYQKRSCGHGSTSPQMGGAVKVVNVNTKKGYKRKTTERERQS